MVRLASFKGLVWPLDDELAEAMQPGLVLKMGFVVRFEDVADYANERKVWVTSVLEVGALHD